MIQGIQIPFRAIMKKPKPIRTVTVAMMESFVDNSMPRFFDKGIQMLLIESGPEEPVVQLLRIAAALSITFLKVLDFQIHVSSSFVAVIEVS